MYCSIDWIECFFVNFFYVLNLCLLSFEEHNIRLKNELSLASFWKEHSTQIISWRSPSAIFLLFFSFFLSQFNIQSKNLDKNHCPLRALAGLKPECLPKTSDNGSIWVMLLFFDTYLELRRQKHVLNCGWKLLVLSLDLDFQKESNVG